MTGFMWDHILQSPWCQNLSQWWTPTRWIPNTTYNDFAISWKVLPTYLWFQRSSTSLSVWKYELLLMRSTQRLFYVGQRMLPLCPFNMFSVKFCVLPLGPCTCCLYACELHSKFFSLAHHNIYSSICPVMKLCAFIYFSSILKCHTYSKSLLYE